MNDALKVAGITAGVVVLGPVVVIFGLAALFTAAFWLQGWRDSREGLVLSGPNPPRGSTEPTGDGKRCVPVSAGYDADPTAGPVILQGAIYDGPELPTQADADAANALELEPFATDMLTAESLAKAWANLNAALAKAGVTGTQLQLWFMRRQKSGAVCLPGTIVAWSDTLSSAVKASKGAQNKYDEQRAVRLARNRIRSYRAALILWQQAGSPSL